MLVVIVGRGRYLALYRDLSGVEFVHEEDLQDYVSTVKGTESASVSVDSVPGKAEQLKSYTTLLPIRSAETKWETPVNKESHLPTHLTRKDLQRSTYADPPSWLFPFPKDPKRKRTTLKTTSKLNIAASREEVIPKCLLLRILHDIEVPDRNVIDDVQEGLLKYCEFAQDVYKMYDRYKLEDARTQEEREVEERLLEQVPQDVMEKYRIGVNKRSVVTSQELHAVSSEHKWRMSRFYREVEHDKGQVEVYKDLLSRKSIPVYFDTVHGESFNTVLKAVDKSVQISR